MDQLNSLITNIAQTSSTSSLPPAAALYSALQQILLRAPGGNQVENKCIEKGSGKAGGKQVNAYSEHPLSWLPVASLVSGLFSTGWNSSKSIENQFRLMRKLEAQTSSVPQRFRCLLTAIRGVDPKHHERAREVIKARKKQKKEKALKLMRKRLASLGLSYKGKNLIEKIKADQEKDAAALDDENKFVAEVDVRTNPDVCRIDEQDWATPEPELPNLLKKLGRSSFPKCYFDFQHELPRGADVMQQLPADPKTGAKSYPHINPTDINHLTAHIIIKTWQHLTQIGVQPGSEHFEARLTGACLVGGDGKAQTGDMVLTEDGSAFLLTFATAWGAYGAQLVPHKTRHGHWRVDSSKMCEMILADATRMSLCDYTCVFRDEGMWLRVNSDYPFLKAVAFRDPDMSILKKQLKRWASRCNEGPALKHGHSFTAMTRPSWSTCKR